MDDVTLGHASHTHHVTSAGRRISFQPEAVFQSVIQDGDTHELFVFLTNTDLFQVDIDLPNHTGITALHQSVLYNNLDMVKLLLTSGADVNLSDVNGLTPLHTASACGFLHVASMLLVFGADLFAQTKEGDLPVDFAKDMDMMIFLHDEMVAKIQRQDYFRSMILHEGRKFLLLCLTTCVFYVKIFLDFVVLCFNEYYTKQKKRICSAASDKSEKRTGSREDSIFEEEDNQIPHEDINKTSETQNNQPVNEHSKQE